MFMHILLPTDLGDRSRIAADAVKDLAGSDDQPTVTLLHVIETVSGASFDEFRTFYDELEARSRAKLNALSEYLEKAGTIPNREVVYGKPVEQIVTFAEDHAVDLIVLASHPLDLSQPGRRWGTISHRVGLLAPCAVLLAKDRTS